MPPREWEMLSPIVLCGGLSSRFGSNKLLAPLPPAKPASGGAFPLGHAVTVMVDRPIAALRAVFGSRVLLAGHCESAVLERADGVIHDPYPAIGPAGGILAALEACPAGVFVLSGDLPWIDAATIMTLCNASDAAPDAAAVLAVGEMVEPCIGIYRARATDFLRVCTRQPKAPPLHSLIPESERVLVEVDRAKVRNVNRPDELDPATVPQGRAGEAP